MNNEVVNNFKPLVFAFSRISILKLLQLRGKYELTSVLFLIHAGFSKNRITSIIIKSNLSNSPRTFDASKNKKFNQ